MISFNLSNRTVRYTGLGTLIALIALMSVLGIYYLSALKRDINTIEVEHRSRLEDVDHLLSEFIKTRGLLTIFVIEEQTDLNPLIRMTNNLIDTSEIVQSNLPHEHDQEAMERFIKKLKEYKVAMVAYSEELLLRRTGEGVRSWEATLLNIENEAHAIGLELKTSIRQDIGLLEKDIIRRSENARRISILLAVVGVLLGFFVAILLQRALSQPIRELVRATKEIAGGDLNKRARIESKDEIGELAVAFNKMTETLSGTLVSKGYLDSIIKSIADTLLVADSHGKITKTNQAALDMLGYAESELVGSTLEKICAQKGSTGKSHQFMNNLMEQGSIQSFETTCTTKRGQLIPAILSGAVMKNEKEHITDIVIVIKDITERKKTEVEIIEARKKAEEASSYKSEFLANMSHEIRTPMNAIIGMSAIALDTHLTQEQQDYLTTIQESGYALLNIINDILDFSKIEAGKLKIDNVDFNLRLTVEGSADTLAHQASEKKLELACLVHHEVPSLITGDPARIRQILLNLGSNALKFTEKGEVVIRVEPVEETDDTATVLFSVSDTGIGISPDKQKSIFEDFVQADGTTTRVYGGTGLGLSISKKLVELMKGEIGVESTVGKGSRFWFRLSFGKQKEGERVAEKPESDLKNLRILVADDNETNRKILVRMAESFGCRSESVTSGADAVRELKNGAASGDPFKVLLLDMMMPGMSGEHTTIIIKNTPEIKDTIIIILTSLGSRGDTAYMHSIGCAGYLVKPVKQSLLQETISAILRGGPQLDRTESTDFVTRFSITEKKFQNIQILLVEDNPVNQKTAATMLRKAGYVVDTAENGRIALEVLHKRTYDIVLMDIQMPEMDGFEATEAIREEEGDSQHTIIIAMTAHALEGDREKCLEKGMDDYIAKPINPQIMFTTLKKWIKSKVESSVPHEPVVEALPRPAPVVGDTDKPSPIDLEAAMSRFGNDREFFKDMVREFLDYVPGQIQHIEQAAEAGDSDAVQKNAHSIKGAAGNLSAQNIAHTALMIEEKGRSGDVSGIPSQVKYLKSEISRLRKFIENF
jgi:PAS domain S-box-containing protein